MYEPHPNGCWIWTGPTCSSGRYGRLPNTKLKMAHRDAYEKTFGEIPNGMCVCHTCDNGLCVNPQHLFLGSHSDNMKDAAKKKRIPRLLDQSGVNNGNAKYDKQFADAIRAYYAKEKPSFSLLAKVFHLRSKGHAHAIVTNRIWK